ncbi:MAG: TIGR01459 family HAD-type hydrolase [Alphaproteobacteria bacterium]|nr:TIGR01459 family HAD-type hydrolase [Alphaproteobacteria bacterium]
MMNVSGPAFPAITGLSQIAGRYDVIFCDVWGVVHNGKAHFPDACEALRRFRAGGGKVVLVTNAPRPFPPILEQLASLGVPREAFDELVTSGDVTLALIAARANAPVYHIGPARDLSLFEILKSDTGIEARLTGPGEADYVVCTGPFRDEETPADYEDQLQAMRARNLDFICANPDVVIHRGEQLVYCSGALAQRYEQLGGRTIQAGKPFAPIYRRALDVAEKLTGKPVAKERILAIGDGMHTDIAGAGGQGIDALFVTMGIHRDKIHAPGPDGAPGALDIDAARALLAGAKLPAIAAISMLAW